MAGPSSSSVFLVIMAGGKGTRFWPKSTFKKPKQLLSFSGRDEDILLVQTLNRFRGWIPENQVIIVTTEDLAPDVQRLAGSARVLSEPEGRNTAPCILWALKEISKTHPEAVVCVMPSDHFIPNPRAFSETVQAAAQWAAEHEDLVTLGVRPSRPETGFGYLHAIEKMETSGEALKVKAFVEKPDLARAKEYLKSGEYLWNAGMFVWRADVALRAYSEFLPEMVKTWDAAEGANILSVYPKLEAISVDYGIMEKSDRVVTFPLDCGWDDLGNWSSLETLEADFIRQEDVGRVLSGQIVSIDSKSNVVDAPEMKVGLLGVNDLIVVRSGDRLLIADKSRAQEIRDLAKKAESLPDSTD